MKALTFFILSCALPITAVADNAKKETQQQIVQSAISQIEANLSAENFDQFIAKKYRSTHRFLTHLSRKQQKEVYEYYKKESDFGAIRHKIFELFFAIS